MSASKPVSAFSPRSMLLPLALAQFIASYACTNMNVAVSAIAKDLGTTVIGVQTAITLFTLTMAASGFAVGAAVDHGASAFTAATALGAISLAAGVAWCVGLQFIGREKAGGSSPISTQGVE